MASQEQIRSTSPGSKEICSLANVSRIAGPITLTLNPVRINPVSDLRRSFMWRVSAAAVKLLLLGAILYFAMKYLLSDLVQLPEVRLITPGPPVSLEGVLRIFTLGCVLAFIAILEFIHKRLALASRLKPSVDGLEEKIRQCDGDLHPQARTPGMQAEARGSQGGAS